MIKKIVAVAREFQTRLLLMFKITIIFDSILFEKIKQQYFSRNGEKIFHLLTDMFILISN